MPNDLLKNARFKALKYAEGRAVFEWQSFYLLRRLMRRLPKGDGHPVIVFPGFVSSDIATRPMRSLFDDLGYSTYGWGLGRNLIFDQKRERQMRNLLKNVYESEGRKVSLIGWSLGGLFAREIAKANPEYVRCVISLGSPISGAAAQSNAKNLFQAINGNPGEHRRGHYQDTNQPPPVPTSSIYSKTDGVVHWESSVQRGSYPQTENIEVPASHLGLGVNPLVMMAVADRLAQPQGEWAPFDRSGLKRFVFTDSKQTWGKALASLLQRDKSHGV